MAGSQIYLDWLEGMKQLHLSKNAGYSPGADPWANFRMSEGIGIPAWKGALVRLGDKFARVMALANNPNADEVDEPIEDTLSDLAAYAGIVRALYMENRGMTGVEEATLWSTAESDPFDDVDYECCKHDGPLQKPCPADCQAQSCLLNPKCPCREAC